MRYGDVAGPLAIAHRGGAGLAPENTLEAFGRSYDLGFRLLETDVRPTRDGVAVCLHDPDLRRTTGVRAPVAALDVDGVRRLGVPRLSDVLGAFPDAGVVVDVKDPRVLPGLLDAVRRTGATERVCLAGAWDGVLARAREDLGPRLTTTLGWRGLARLVLGAGPAGVPRAPGEDLAHLPVRRGPVPVLTRRVVDRAHASGLRVVAWTVDDPAQMHHLLDAGVDGVITDRPDLLREVLVARGAWVRPPGADRPAASTGAEAGGGRRRGPRERAAAPSRAPSPRARGAGSPVTPRP